MLQDILIPLAVVGIAELGDKTQIAIFLLSTKTREHLRLLVGVLLAFLIVDGIAVAVGGYVTQIVPMGYIKIISGLIFIFFGIISLLSLRKEEISRELTNPFYSGFTIIFLSELGDKTQIAAGIFATQYHPLFVLIGVMGALSILSILALYLGKVVATKVDERTLSVLDGIIFIVIGVVILLG
jgi:putative Ca2+/H+ antiporter (TMEM165/GDT1 family)